VSVVAIAIGALSGLGRGDAAFDVATLGAPAPRSIRHDEELARAGFSRPFASRVALDAPPSIDRATALLDAALADALAMLDVARPAWRTERVGIAIGTSSGGMLSAERLFAARAAGAAIDAELARDATYFAPFQAAIARAGLPVPALATQVLAACAASTIAIGLAMRWLARDACDVVLAGGYDGLSTFVAAGFEALRATTASTPKPFRVGRDGMSLGEGAGIVALVRADRVGAANPLAFLAGFGATMDAVHITAPDRSGGGLARAAEAALRDAGLAPARVGLVSAHGTATPFNDAMEHRAIARALGHERAVVHPFKSQIGHTLGAAGVLEMLATARALNRGVAPAAASEGETDPDCPAVLLDRATSIDDAHDAALKLSAAFGGTNAALVLTRGLSTTTRPHARRRVAIAAYAYVTDVDLMELSEATGIARDRLARADLLGRLAMGAVAALATKVGKEALVGAGIVVGHALATIGTNEQFDRKKREKGPTFVEPRLFPATSPNAVAGECAIAFQLTGPGFAVGASLDGGNEALGCAAELVAAGDCDRAVVVAADEAAPTARAMLEAMGLGDRRFEQGALAILIAASNDSSLREVELMSTDPRARQTSLGSAALLELLEM
jgi:3-oxoacyl-[acyl-carrier-protein] synthase-1/3-oxoacyl-[acyl-carrier-protein] synthase II